MILSRHIRSFLTLTALTFFGAIDVSASFLDSDFYCRTYGCAVIHDGASYDIYDNYLFSSGTCCVAIGGQMESYNTYLGQPNSDKYTNLTGTLSTNIGPNAAQSMMFGIENNGGVQNFLDDGDGYLDAGDSMSAFALNSATDVILAGSGRQYSHSFFITSRNTRFSLRALASIANVSGDFASTIGLGDIKLTPSISNSGNDLGYDYGGRANSGSITIANGVDDLGDLTGLPTQIMYFGRNNGIRQRNGDIDQQTIRLDFLYTMPEYDFSMGIGSLNLDVVFDFYREQ